MNRFCSSCKTNHPLSSFYRSQKGKDGYDSRCKKCKNADRVQYQKVSRAKHKQAVIPPAHPAMLRFLYQ